MGLVAITGVLIFVLGSAVGSFLNVCIWRMPREESIISPWSHCPHCGTSLPWYDNIPFLSFILLRGKCRFCKKGISFRYFLIELITALSFLFLFFRFRNDLRLFFIQAILVSCLIAVSFIDLKHLIIPDQINFFGLAAGLILSFIYPPLHQIQSLGGWTPADAGRSLLNAVLGGLVGGGLIYVTGVLGTMAFKKEAMGGGDVKLMAMIGVFLGWKLTLLTFFLAPFLGTPVGIFQKLKYKTSTIPYGPFLALAAFITLFWGERILQWLFGYFYV